MKKSGFKMKNPSVAKLAKAAGSPMRKDKPTYKEAFENMEIKTDDEGTWRRNKRNKFLYKDDEGGYDAFVNDAKLYNAKQKNKNVARVEPKKPTDTKKTIKTVAEPKTQKEVRKAKRKAVAAKIFGSGSKRKANEANKKKRQSRSVTGRMKAKASKFGRMGT